MPLKLDVQKVLHGKSERVKCVDIHPKEPWILSALYSGNVYIWNYSTETIVRTFEICEVPVRTAKFIARKHWFVCGTDDMHIRVYNYNTCEKIREFEAHTDYIRSLAVHPSLPFLLSASDDMSIKLWDWDNQWENCIIFEGHTHYVMQIAINPKDNNSFASASLDRSVKIWGLNSSVPHFQLEGHDRGVNCISYYSGGERPFIVSGADDNLVKIWDYQTKTCIATLEGHSANISAVLFHPQLPIIMSGSEDGSIKIWHNNTYRLETTLHYAMERVWTMAAMMNHNNIAIGFDEGTIMIKLGNEEPIVSMDSSGKVIWARHHEIQLTKILRGKKENYLNVSDGEQLQLATDDLGSTEFYPSYLQHNCKGQLIAVCGDGEYTIYTSLSLKHKSFGEALSFAWCSQSNSMYATKVSSSKIKIYNKFTEFKSIRTSYSVDKIFGGHLLGVTSMAADDVYFYNFNDGKCIRRIEVRALNVYWSSDGTLCAIICRDNFYVLRFNCEIVDKYIAANVNIEQHGIESAFTLENDINDRVLSGCFSGEIFIYISSNQRLCYYIGGEIITLVHLDSAYYVLGYIQKANRVYLIDKFCNIVSYELLRYVLAFQAAIVGDDLRTANKLIESGKILDKYHNKLALFLQNKGHKEFALRVSKDPEHQFELALSLGQLDLAKKILLIAPTQQKWKQLADLALTKCDFSTTEQCAINAMDYGLLYLLYTGTNNRNGLDKLVEMSVANNKYNIAFNTLFYLGNIEKCCDLLIDCNKVPQAAMLSRAYCPQRIDEIQKIWKEELSKISPAAANALGDTQSHPLQFPDTQSQSQSHDEDADAYDEKQQDKEEEEVEDVIEERIKEEEEETQERERERVNTNDSIEDISDEVSLPSGIDDDDDDVLNGDGNDSEFDIDDLDDM